MQGFNKYYPPDYDPKTAPTLNAYRGVHALGARAKDIDKGILVVRFELPYNIWCGTCGSHIGAGVRYNAQKRRVGNYYSTPVWAFRCKCHLCGGWFEIRTDPKNAAYVVHEGAKAQAQDWDPLENGGYRPTDTDAPTAAESALADPFAHLEKSTTQAAAAKSEISRLTALTQLSHRQTSDPYTMSQHARARFREGKKADQARAAADEAVRARTGLGIKLEPHVQGEGADEWARTGRAGKRAVNKVDVQGLAVQARRNTVRKMDVFGGGVGGGPTRTTKAKIGTRKTAAGKGTVVTPSAPAASGLVDYGSDSG